VLIRTLARCLRHLWHDSADARRAVPDDMADRLARRIAASEQRHSGEIRICVEAALPLSLAWAMQDDTTRQQVIRARALDWFARLHIWDTEQNNGVLIYLLLTEHAIEIVADRGVCDAAAQARWQGITRALGERLRSHDMEGGLTGALEEVSALLVAQHPVTREEPNPDELPNLVVRA
jgi:uncharacterized membrane protein